MIVSVPPPLAEDRSAVRESLPEPEGTELRKVFGVRGSDG